MLIETAGTAWRSRHAVPDVPLAAHDAAGVRRPRSRPTAHRRREVHCGQRNRSRRLPEAHRHHGGRRPRPGASTPWSWARPWRRASWAGRLVGIRDGFDGLLHPERYPDGGLVTLGPGLIENLDPAGAGILGQAPRVDPFHVRRVNADEMVEELDLSDELLERLKAEKIDALDLRRRRPGPEHPLQAPPQGAQRRVRAPVDRERHRRHRGLLRLQQRAQLHHRDARPGRARRPSPPGRSAWWRSWASRPAGWRCRPASPCAPMRC